MPFPMLILPYQILSNCWRADYGKQKRENSIKANAENRPCYMRGRDRGVLYQPFENMVQVAYQNSFAHRRYKDNTFACREPYKGTENLTVGQCTYIPNV